MPKHEIPQTYQLIMHVKKSIMVQVGKLGRFQFPAGFYVYTGSAKKGMAHRLARHQAKMKKMHWHIDYLLANKNVEIVDIKTFLQPECDINLKTKGEIIAKRFGASDCRQNCGSHLLYTGDAQP